MKRLLPLALCISAPSVRADLPLSLEELLTEKGKLRLESSLAYINGEQQKGEFANPVFIQTGTASFVPVPTELREQNRNSDMLVATLGLRYGLTGKTDVYGNANHIWRNERSFNGEREYSRSSRNLADVSLGISHTFVQDGKNPALIGFAETAVYEKSQGKAALGKGWLVGATTYKAIDPVVLSLTAAYKLNLAKNTDNGRYRAGNFLMLNPSVSFAANDRISINGGVQWIAAQADKLDGNTTSPKNTSSYAHAGVGLGIGKDTALNASARFKVSGQGSAEWKLGISHTF
ncbi:hypothetical protein [Conchiformibius kuhniae]|uniref:Meta-pathway of phenol degradation family protein n=1 Tax=Conchiformibius kuhniae TaxID=211502 RepID=A0A8T9MW86_9NEIS|nr:hypothetical protein [Conchiformibius kuhniae]UOP04688.1 meta-pathway of phenol degradation family protein [Conchiformibius kuhniae]